MTFLLKKLIGALLMPLTLIVIALISTAVLWSRGRKMLAKLLFFASVFSLYLLSTSPLTSLIVNSLEGQYEEYSGQPVDYVVVLGSSHKTRSLNAPNNVLSGVALSRLTEGLRVYRANPGAKLILSGYQGLDTVPHAKMLAEQASTLDVPNDDMIVLDHPKDTFEEAQAVAGLVGNKRVAIATSATHMPRAMALFEYHQVESVAAPTYFIGTRVSLSWQSFVPNAWALYANQASWHEYLGLLWIRIKYA